ncbi:MAG: DUF4232 domain-containing protein [Actinoplanes sp.]
MNDQTGRRHGGLPARAAVSGRPSARRDGVPGPAAALVTVALVTVALVTGCANAAPAPSPLERPGQISSSPPTIPHASTIPTRSASPSPTCPATGVRLEFDQVDAAMGLRALGVRLINCGRSTYRVDGYPSVHLLDEQETVLKVRVLRGITDISISIPDWDGPPRPVSLRPGEHATAILVWRNTYDDTRKPPVNAPLVKVAPLAGRPAQVLPLEGGIDLGSTGRLGTSPWRKLPDPNATATSTPRETPASPPVTSATPTAPPPLP